ncbi:unnamed protein product, partial [Prorocentrum cordatum]
KQQDKSGSTANERWKQARRSDAKLSLGAGLHDGIKSAMNAIYPEVELPDGHSRPLRAGGQSDQRTLGAIFATRKSQEHILLTYSGYQRVTFTFSYIGAESDKQEQDKQQGQTAWLNKIISMQDACSISVSHE